MSQRHLLLLTYTYPPTPSIGGVRAAGLAKYLHRFGWHVTVVTPRGEPPRTSSGEIVETDPAEVAGRFKRWLGVNSQGAFKDAVASDASPARHHLRSWIIETVKAAVAIPDTHRGWIRLAEQAASRCLDRRRFEVLLSTSPPVSAHVAAARLRRRRGVPWVADLRDLWSENHNSQAPAWRRRIDRRIERRVLSAADALVTVSAPLAARLASLQPGTPCHAIVSGFDPDIEGLGSGLDGLFTITHTGSFHQGRRDPSRFLDAVGDVLARGTVHRDRLRIRLFARGEPWLQELVSSRGLGDVVQLIPWSTRERALAIQQESQVLLLIHPDGAQERPVYTGKVFEYLAARRPILVVGGDPGVLTELVAETRAGVHAPDRAETARWLERFWTEYEARGSVSWRGDEAAVARYSQLRMAEEFARLLDTVAGEESP